MNPALLDPAVVGRLPAPGDNVAIAVRRLEAGARALAFTAGPGKRSLAAHRARGHRFAVAPDRRRRRAALVGSARSGTRASTAIAPGDYVCNQSMLDAHFAVSASSTARNFLARNQTSPISLGEPFAFDEK